MRNSFLIFSFLFITSIASATDSVVNFALFPDEQAATDCAQSSTAWSWVTAAFDWVANHGSFVGAIQVGDFTKNSSATGADCECLGTDPSPGACADINHSVYGTGYCTSCNDPDAITCTDGTPGRTCEWDRAKALVDLLVGIPTLVTAGNRDHAHADAWGTFNDYFGPGNLPSDALVTGSHIATVDSGSDAGDALAADSYMIVEGGNQRWLFIQIHYFIDDESVAWINYLTEKYKGMPTVIVSHMMHLPGDAPTGWTYTAQGANGPKLLSAIGNNPQIFLHLSGHNSDMLLVKDTTYTYVNLGIMFDYSYDNTVTGHTLYDGASSRQLEAYGGGGVVGILSFHLDAGKVSFYVYSPALDDASATSRGFDEHRVDENFISFFTEQIDFCGSGRFIMDPGACDGFNAAASFSDSSISQSSSQAF